MQLKLVSLDSSATLTIHCPQW